MTTEGPWDTHDAPWRARVAAMPADDVARGSSPPPAAAGAGAVRTSPFDLAALFREHHTFVWRVIRRLGVDPGGIDDAVQEVFVVMHRRRFELDDRSAPRALLFGIARRVAARHRDRGRAGLHVVADEPVAERGDPEESITLDEQAGVVRGALDAMDEDKRVTFLLADVEGMTMPQIADAMDVNLNTAYARLRAARMLIERAVARHLAREEGARVRERSR
jgi:RNA polymerase sigma-70 factor, ECF subfamily